MENAVSMSITPLQLILAMAFQIWLVAFPILILRRLKSIEQRLNELTIEEVEDSSNA